MTDFAMTHAEQQEATVDAGNELAHVPRASDLHEQSDALPLRDISAADIALVTFIIEERLDISRSMKPDAGGLFPGADRMEDFLRNPGSTEVRSFDLTDIVFIPACGALLRAGQMISETRYLFSEEDYRRHLSRLGNLQFSGSGKTVVIGFNGAYGNYYHWMMQSLPAIDWSIRNAGAQNCILALPPLSAGQEETLAILGLAGLPRIQIDLNSQYHFQRVHYCEYLNGKAAFFLSPRVLQVLDRLAAHVDQPPDAPPRLYIARSDSTNRILRNEDDVRRLLEGRGFITIIPGHYSVRDQIRLFRGATIIVGAHGAGLTNVVFCGPRATILELVQSNYLNPCIVRIAQGRNLLYHAECFESDVNPDVHKQDWVVDIKQLEAKLEVLLVPPGEEVLLPM